MIFTEFTIIHSLNGHPVLVATVLNAGSTSKLMDARLQ